MNIANHEIQPAEAKMNRPWPITVLCVFGVLMWLQILGGTLALFIFKDVPLEGYITGVIFLVILFFDGAGVVGYWKMRRWGIYSYLLARAVSFLAGYFYKWHPGLEHFLIPAVYVLVGLFYFKRMK